MLPCLKACVTLVLEDLNLHCFTKIAQAPVPSGYHEPSDSTVLLCCPLENGRVVNCPLSVLLRIMARK